MQICILEKEDYELVDKMVKTSLSIEDLYKKLCLLEVFGKKDSSQYEKFFNYLLIALEVEKNLYDNNDLNSIKSKTLIEYLIDQEKSQKIISDSEYIVKGNTTDANIRRVINKLYTKMNSDYSGMRLLLEEDGIDYSEDFYNDWSIKSYAENDVNYELNRLFLSNLSSMMNDSNYKHFTFTKYVLSFLDHTLEEDMINSRFSFDNNVCLYGNALAEICKMKNDYEFHKSGILIKRVLYNLKKMSLLNENTSKEELELREAYLKAYFALLDDNTLADLNKKYYGILRIISKNGDKLSSYVHGIIKNCFIDAKKDREKILTLKLPRNN